MVKDIEEERKRKRAKKENERQLRIAEIKRIENEERKKIQDQIPRKKIYEEEEKVPLVKNKILEEDDVEEEKFHGLAFSIQSSLDERLPLKRINKGDDEETMKVVRQLTEIEE